MHLVSHIDSIDGKTRSISWIIEESGNCIKVIKNNVFYGEYNESEFQTALYRYAKILEESNKYLRNILERQTTMTLEAIEEVKKMR